MLMMMATLMIFVCFWLSMKIGGSDYSERRINRNGQLMNAMKKIPYSQFMLQEARDCPICLESFTNTDDVV